MFRLNLRIPCSSAPFAVAHPEFVPTSIFRRFPREGRLQLSCAWQECIKDARCAIGSGPFPIESIDFLDAGVADIERRLVGGDAGPVSESSRGPLKAFRAEDTLQFAVADSNPVITLFVLENPVKIHIACVSGPIWIAYEHLGKLSPFLSREIKKHGPERIHRNGGDVTSVWGPAGRKQAIGSRQFRGFSRFHIEQIDR